MEEPPEDTDEHRGQGSGGVDGPHAGDSDGGKKSGMAQLRRARATGAARQAIAVKRPHHWHEYPRGKHVGEGFGAYRPQRGEDAGGEHVDQRTGDAAAWAADAEGAGKPHDAPETDPKE